MMRVLMRTKAIAVSLSSMGRCLSSTSAMSSQRVDSMLTGGSKKPGETTYFRFNRQTFETSDLLFQSVSGASSVDIELSTSPTPNGHKVSIFLEELNIPYKVKCIDLSGEQFTEDFLRISPNSKIPALYDCSMQHNVFESGAILTYLADKYDSAGVYFPRDDISKRSTVLQWVFWQMANLGPMMGQCITFNRFAPETIPYAIQRYTTESRRLLEVLDRQLAANVSSQFEGFICGHTYPSIADFAVFPWVRAHRMAKVPLDDLEYVSEWLMRMKLRPSVKSGLTVGFPNTPLGIEMGLRYSNDQRMTHEQKEAFMKGGRSFLHEKAEALSELTK